MVFSLPSLLEVREAILSHNVVLNILAGYLFYCSVGGFFQRHFGKEVVDYLIDPFVAGTCAGDPESLSMPHAFPELWNLEKEFGSIIFGAIRSKFSAKRGKSGALNSSSTNKKHLRGSFSFLGGMQTLTDALCKDLGKDEPKLQSRVLELSYSCENSVSESWSISYALIHDKQSEEQSFDAVVMTLCKCFTWLSYKGNSIAMTWVLQMLHLPCYFGQPRRHLLTTGWSAFINKKKLVSGDAVLFLRGGDGELRLGIRRAAQVKTDSTFPALSSQKLNVGTISAVYQLSKCTTCTICLFFFFFLGYQRKIVISTGMEKFLQSNSFDIVPSMIITSMVCWQVEICSSCRRQGKLHSHLGNEVFREFLPPLLVNNAVLPWFDPAVLGGFLCLPAFTDVWVMKEYRKKESWTKFSFCKREDISTRIDLVCLLEGGEFLLSRDEEQLVVYNSKDETSRDMVVCGIPGSFTSGGTYVESLISPERIHGIGRQCEACERMKRILQVMVETYEAGTCQSSTNKESYRVEPSSSSSNIEASTSRLTMLK
ncbi:hypothetical protein LOK49_LG08G00527 [Camellia lanceoleosa]|uniref:Uncharacterized protein n=2 Tax=Camellia lanceoleosa TaxID=1840588 RepID=A0ACC0GY76_9ERIC|nr:hypothetical protein LOK49_LG08G00527 [Camellia lanceoleosa]